MAFYGSAAGFKQIALPAAALATPVTDAIIEEHLALATEKAESYFRGRYTVPLDSPQPGAVVTAVYAIAALSLLTWRGFNPDSYDENFRENQRDALKWLADIAAGRANLAVTADATDTTYEGGSAVELGSVRGWNDEGLSGVGELVGSFWSAPKPD